MWPSFEPRFLKRFQDVVHEFKPTAIHLDLIGLAHLTQGLSGEKHVIRSINDAPGIFLRDEARNAGVGVLRKLYNYSLIALVAHLERVLLQSGIVRVVSEVDRTYLRGLSRRAQIITIPNRLPGPKNDRAHVYCNAGFLGVLDGSMDNIMADFLETIWARIRHRSNSNIFLGGSRVGPRCRKLAGDRGVNLCSPIENLEDFFAAFGILINPLRRRCGVSNKLLEGMAAGKACIGYKETFGGLPFAANGRNCVMVNDPQDFELSLGRLLSDPEEVRRIGDQAVLDLATSREREVHAKLIEMIYLEHRQSLSRGDIPIV
jgi:hypothetical protein